MPGASSPFEVFYSYAHEDEALRAELEKHLSLLRPQEVISGWHDRHLAPGTDWAQAIDEHLERAAVILLLVSADFLASEALTSSYVTAASLLALPEREAQEQAITVQAVKTWLQTHRGLLLILDNADDLTLVPAFLPPALGGHLLLTTQATALLVRRREGFTTPHQRSMTLCEA
jgi:hypothetical protein